MITIEPAGPLINADALLTPEDHARVEVIVHFYGGALYYSVKTFIQSGPLYENHSPMSGVTKCPSICSITSPSCIPAPAAAPLRKNTVTSDPENERDGAHSLASEPLLEGGTLVLRTRGRRLR